MSGTSDEGSAHGDGSASATAVMNDVSYTAVVNGEPRKIPYSFFRGDHANFMPRRPQMQQPESARTFIFEGLMPPAPFIHENTCVVAFGSCFAANIANYLAAISYNVSTKRDSKAYVSSLADGMVTTHAILQQFKWAWTDWEPPVALWHGKQAEQYDADAEIRNRTKALFDTGDVFIITLGLSEVWYDEPTGEVFWRAVPADRYDPTRHKFRTVPQAENKANLREIYDLIRRNRPDASIVFTLSPIPLIATFRPVGCIIANAASKASLKSAIDELYQEIAPIDSNFYYFPAYEIVTQALGYAYMDDLRHPYLHVIDVCMKAFERYFCQTGLNDADIDNVFGRALDLDRRLQSGDDEAKREARRTHIQSALAYDGKAGGIIVSGEARFEDNARIRAERNEGRRLIQAERAARQAARLERQAANEQRRAERVAKQMSKSG